MSRKKSLVPDASCSLLSEDDMVALLAQNPQAANANPMVRKYGFGPTGETCKTCRFRFSKRFANTYHKCEHWFPGSGAVSDIRVGWDACAKHEPTQTGQTGTIEIVYIPSAEEDDHDLPYWAR